MNHTTCFLEVYKSIVYHTVTELCNDHHSWVQNIFAIPKRNPRPVSSHSPFPPNPSSRRRPPSICLYRCVPFWTGPASGFLLYVVFCDWLLSFSTMLPRFIHLISRIICTMALFITRVSAFLSSLHDGPAVFGALPLQNWLSGLCHYPSISLFTYLCICSKYLEQKLHGTKNFPCLTPQAVTESHEP